MRRDVCVIWSKKKILNRARAPSHNNPPKNRYFFFHHGYTLNIIAQEEDEEKYIKQNITQQ